MKSIAMFNNKGGVGKTTLLCNLAAFLSLRRGKRILLIDADPQCNATQSTFDDDTLDELYTQPSFTLIDVIRPLALGKGFTKGIKPKRSTAFGFDVLPGDPDMSLMEDLLATDWVGATSGDVRGLRTTLLFRNLLERMKDQYDFVFFDMGPSLGSINRSVLIAADYYITPMSIDIFSLRAITNIGKSLKTWRRKFEKGLAEIDDRKELEVRDPDWNLSFLGYVNQQYIRKSIRGQQQAVKAYDKIMKHIPGAVAKELAGDPGSKTQCDPLGSIPNLHSLVPLSQTNHTPIFELKGKHGVVGAHFAKVREYEQIIGNIADRFLHRAD